MLKLLFQGFDETTLHIGKYKHRIYIKMNSIYWQMIVHKASCALSGVDEKLTLAKIPTKDNNGAQSFGSTMMVLKS